LSVKEFSSIIPRTMGKGNQQCTTNECQIKTNFNSCNRWNDENKKAMHKMEGCDWGGFKYNWSKKDSGASQKIVENGGMVLEAKFQKRNIALVDEEKVE
jgi:hypothetical protein